MGAFDRTEIRVDDAFALTELDSTGEEGKIEVEVPVEDGVATVAVMVEGRGVDCEVDIVGEGELLRGWAGGAEPDAVPRQLFLRAGHHLKTVRLKIRTQGARVKVSVLRIFRQFAADLRKRMSCTACKKLVRFVITWLLTGLGVPDVPMDGALPASVWARLREWLALGDLGELPPIVAQFLAALHSEFVKQLIEALRWVLAFVNEMYETIDSVLTWICRRLGFCAAAAAA